MRDATSVYGPEKKKNPWGSTMSSRPGLTEVAWVAQAVPGYQRSGEEQPKGPIGDNLKHDSTPEQPCSLSTPPP